jgi:hypothetical protein
MKAKLVYHVKEFMQDESFQEIKIWQVPPTKVKPHGLKYSFVYVVNGERVIGYDNAEHKGTHRHYKNREYPYKFESLEKLCKDFKKDIERFKEGKL